MPEQPERLTVEIATHAGVTIKHAAPRLIVKTAAHVGGRYINHAAVRLSATTATRAGFRIVGAVIETAPRSPANLGRSPDPGCGASAALPRLHVMSSAPKRVVKTSTRAGGVRLQHNATRLVIR